MTNDKAMRNTDRATTSMKVHSIAGKEVGSINLPKQFSEEIRKDLIKRAYNAVRTHDVQPKGVSPDAGMRQRSELTKRRRKLRSVYGHGGSRSPKKMMSHAGRQFALVGATTPFAVKGRVAHPPKSWKDIDEKINTKERKKAIRSAITASKIMIIESKLEKLKKTNEVIKALESNGLKIEAKKRLKKGKARLRGRQKSYSKGPLLIVTNKCELLNSGKNLPGIEVVKVNELNVKVLAPGSIPGRVTIWSEDSIKKMSSEGLYL